MGHIVRRLFRQEEGSVIVVIAIAFTVFLGFLALAVDSGLLYLEHTRISRAADAAALAGAQELPDTGRARTMAEEYAQQNGVDPSLLDISFSPDNKKITVTARKTVNLYFAKALGLTSATVNGRAVGGISPIKKLSGLIPLGINETLLPLSAGTEYMIKGGSQDGSPWRGIIEFPGQGHGASNYRDLVINGYGGVVRIGDTEGKVPGNKSGPTEQGVEDRINSCTDGCTWDNYKPGCPRVVFVPIYRDMGCQVKVVGFASVFLERVGNENGKGNDNRVFATYINNTVSGDTDDSVTNSYLNGVKLTE